MGAYSEKQGEHFHDDILDFERRCQGEYNENMMGNYIWGLRKSNFQYTCKCRKKYSFLNVLERFLLNLSIYNASIVNR